MYSTYCAARRVRSLILQLTALCHLCKGQMETSIKGAQIWDISSWPCYPSLIILRLDKCVRQASLQLCTLQVASIRGLPGSWKTGASSGTRTKHMHVPGRVAGLYAFDGINIDRNKRKYVLQYVVRERMMIERDKRASAMPS